MKLIKLVEQDVGSVERSYKILVRYFSRVIHCCVGGGWHPYTRVPAVADCLFGAMCLFGAGGSNKEQTNGQQTCIKQTDLLYKWGANRHKTDFVARSPYVNVPYTP